MCEAYFEFEQKKYPCGLYLIELGEIQDMEGMDSDLSEFAKPKYLSKAPTLQKQDLTELLNVWEKGMGAWFMQHRVNCPRLKGYFPDESPSIDKKAAEN